MEPTIEQEIAFYEEELQNCARDNDPQQWATYHSLLGNAYQSRRSGDRASNIDIAIEHYQQVLSVRRPDDDAEEWGATQNNLGEAFRKRLHGRRGENLERAIEHYTFALKAFTRDHFPEHWASVQNNLGLAYFYRSSGHRSENLEIARHHLALALDGSPRTTDPGAWAGVHQNLGNVYSERRLGDRSDNLEEAIWHHEQCLEAWTRDRNPRDWASAHHNLAIVHRRRVIGAAVDNLRKAAEHCRLALEVRTERRAPLDRLSTLRTLANVLFDGRDWEESANSYREALRIGQRLLGEAASVPGQLLEIKEISRAFPRLAYCLLRLGRLPDAFSALETGKAQLLGRELAGSDQHPLGRIDVAPSDATFVVPVLSPAGTAVLIRPASVSEYAPEHVVWLDALSDQQLVTWLAGNESEPGLMRAMYLGRQEDGSGDDWRGAIERCMSDVWDRLMGPVVARLRELGVPPGSPIVLLPHGGLGTLPLHAARQGSSGTVLLAEHPVSYAPSARIWSHCRRRASARQTDTLSLLAVVDPSGDLPHARAEAAAVAARFPAESVTLLSGVDATREALELKLEASPTHLHFACHGFYWPGEPGKSALLLATDPNTPVSELVPSLALLGDVYTQMTIDSVIPEAERIRHVRPLTGQEISTRISSQARLVVLSACESGLTEFVDVPDEWLGLAAAFIAAGAQAVVSTLWPVADLSTMLLMEQFYDRHTRGATIARALQEAQMWLRVVTARDLAERFARERSQSQAEHGRPYTEMSDAWRRFARMEPDSRPFSHPYYWAPFFITGA